MFEHIRTGRVMSCLLAMAAGLSVPSGPTSAAPLQPAAIQHDATTSPDLIEVRAAGRRGGVAVGPRGGAVAHRGGAVVGPRGAAYRGRTVAVGPRGNVAVRIHDGRRRARRLGAARLVRLAARRRNRRRCGDRRRDSGHSRGLGRCGSRAGHVLVLHRSVPDPGLLGLLPVMAARHDTRAALMSGYDIFAWIVLVILLASAVGVICIAGWLPGHIAKSRNHPYAQAVDRRRLDHAVLRLRAVAARLHLGLCRRARAQSREMRDGRRDHQHLSGAAVPAGALQDRALQPVLEGLARRSCWCCCCSAC